MTITVSTVLRMISVICFVFAAFGFAPGPLAMVPLGLALWCASTFIP